MTPQERSDKLAKIYETIANKELSFGCKYKYKPRGRMIFTVDSEQIRTNLNLILVQSLGHPVTIGDCLDWIENNEVNLYRRDVYDSLQDLWKSKRLSIDDQSDECVTYIHSLIK